MAVLRQATGSTAMLATLLIPLLLAAPGPDERFIVLSEFQVWADAAGPHVFEELNRLYLERGRSHVFNLYPRYDYYVWDLDRMKHWVDEAKALGAFNVFCLGDDTRTAEGHLFTPDGPNPKLADVFFGTVAHAHQRGLMVAVEPLALPAVRDEEHFRRWLGTWIGPDVPPEKRPDIIKLSLEWFGAYQMNPDIADEVEAFMLACEKVNPEVLVYVDSIGGRWRRPCPFHRWLLSRFPGTIVSHYLGTSQIEAFRDTGARNLMVQINPSEIESKAGQFFIYHERTVDFLQDAVGKRVRYLSLAGVNFGYSRYNYDLFLEVVRPHLALAEDVEALRASLLPDEVAEPVTKDEVRAGLVEEKVRRAKSRTKEPPLPLNAAGKSAVFGETGEGGYVRNLAAIADGRVAVRFQGAYTEPCRRKPVSAVFGRDFGEPREIRKITVVPCLQPDEPTYVATDLRLEYRLNDRWQALPGGTIRANTKPQHTLEFAPVTVDAVRLVVESQTDDGQGNYRACCQEITVE
jgi:hypothetical protein